MPGRVPRSWPATGSRAASVSVARAAATSALARAAPVPSSAPSRPCNVVAPSSASPSAPTAGTSSARTRRSRTASSCRPIASTCLSASSRSCGAVPRSGSTSRPSTAAPARVSASPSTPAPPPLSPMERTYVRPLTAHQRSSPASRATGGVEAVVGARWSDVVTGAKDCPRGRSCRRCGGRRGVVRELVEGLTGCRSRGVHSRCSNRCSNTEPRCRCRDRTVAGTGREGRSRPRSSRPIPSAHRSAARHPDAAEPTTSEEDR